MAKLVYAGIDQRLGLKKSWSIFKVRIHKSLFKYHLLAINTTNMVWQYGHLSKQLQAFLSDNIIIFFMWVI